jgi:hypothetical protein
MNSDLIIAGHKYRDEEVLFPIPLRPNRLCRLYPPICRPTGQTYPCLRDR